MPAMTALLSRFIAPPVPPLRHRRRGANCELTGCSHLTHGAGPGAAGAVHFHDDFTFDLANTSELVTLSETATFVGKNRFTVTVAAEGTGIPLIPGHYSTAELLGFTAPGVSFQVELVKLH
jgi:hypothetical protein